MDFLVFEMIWVFHFSPKQVTSICWDRFIQPSVDQFKQNSLKNTKTAVRFPNISPIKKLRFKTLNSCMFYADGIKVGESQVEGLLETGRKCYIT